MWIRKKQLEFITKLDSYYYDKKLNTTMLVLKIRNKRVKSEVTIKDILHNKDALINLHPIDLCVIGILANELPINFKDGIVNIVTIPNNFTMLKVTPLLEIVGREFTGLTEKILLKINNTDKIVTIAVPELLKNKKLISALQYQDALSLGLSIARHDDIPKFFIALDHYNKDLCIKSCLLLCIFILSILCVNKKINYTFGAYQARLAIEILFLPILFWLQNSICHKLSLQQCNNFFMVLTGIAVILLSYFLLITQLPYSIHDINTMAFNNWFIVVNNIRCGYIIGFICSAVINIWLLKRLRLNTHALGCPGYLNNLGLTLLVISVFFIITKILYVVLLHNHYPYSQYNYAYCLIIYIILDYSLVNFA